jgi:hypothetical protein
VSCVALWKSKGATSKPTPTCVRRNNSRSQGDTHCSRDFGSGRSSTLETSQWSAVARRIFFRPHKSLHHLLRSLPPVTPGRRALPVRGTLQQKAWQKSCKLHLVEVKTAIEHSESARGGAQSTRK